MKFHKVGFILLKILHIFSLFLKLWNFTKIVGEPNFKPFEH